VSTLIRTNAPRGAVLVVDEWVPAPQRDGGSLRMLNLLSVLVGMDYEVTFAARTPEADGGSEQDVRELGVEVVPAGTVEEHLRDCGARYDVVLLSRPDVAAALLGAVRRCSTEALVVYDTLDVYFLREYRLAKLKRSAGLLENALRRKRQELGLVRAADRTLVVSTYEKALLEEACPGASVHVVSNIHPAPGATRPFSERSGMLFVGYFEHGPNLDAARYLVEDVWPLVRVRKPELELHLVGGKPPPWLREHSAAGIHVAGNVDETGLFEHFDRRRASIAPLRFGAGVKGKVLASLGYGLPVVGSTIAFEGIPAVGGRDVLVGDDAETFADAVVRLDQDEELWRRLSGAGPGIVEAHFSFEAAREGLRAAFAPVEIRV
jgi:O-antigen biosynthesis protein